MALRAVGQDAVRCGRGRHDGQLRPLGHIGVHVERPAGTWRSRGVAADLPRRVPRRAWRRRADILGDTGANAPEHWVGGLAGDDLHAIAILFSRTDEQCRRSIEEHDKLLARTDGVRSLSFLDLNATPPFNYAHDHFGFRDRLSQPVMKGSGEEPTPGSGAALEPGEFILGYPDENGPVANLPEPEVLSRNGSYMAYRRLQEHVAVFRDYLRENADTPEDAGAAGGEVHGALAQRRATGAGTGRGRSRTGCRSDAQQRLQLQGDGSVRVCVSARLPCPPVESARHRALHEPSTNDPPGRDVRTRAAGGRARRRGGPRHRRVHHLRRPGPPVRVRAERVDQRQGVPRTRQRTRPDLRHPGRHDGLHRPEAADPQGAQGPSGVHHSAREARTSSCPA